MVIGIQHLLWAKTVSIYQPLKQIIPNNYIIYLVT